MRRFHYEDIVAMPTIHQGQYANLKYDDGNLRIWHSRMTIADGELEPIQVERLVDGCWSDVSDADYRRLISGQCQREGVWVNGELILRARR